MYFRQIGQQTKKAGLRSGQVRLQGFRKGDLSVRSLKILEKTKHDPGQGQPGAVQRVDELEFSGLGVPVADIHSPRLKIREKTAA
jgi:hypothetical protein